MTESGGRRQLSSRQSCFTDNSQSVSWVAQSPQGDTNTNTNLYNTIAKLHIPILSICLHTHIFVYFKILISSISLHTHA